MSVEEDIQKISEIVGCQNKYEIKCFWQDVSEQRAAGWLNLGSVSDIKKLYIAWKADELRWDSEGY